MTWFVTFYLVNSSIKKNASLKTKESVGKGQERRLFRRPEGGVISDYTIKMDFNTWKAEIYPQGV
jgi:hypothetical protein